MAGPIVLSFVLSTLTHMQGDYGSLFVTPNLPRLTSDSSVAVIDYRSPLQNIFATNQTKNQSHTGTPAPPTNTMDVNKMAQIQMGIDIYDYLQSEQLVNNTDKASIDLVWNIYMAKYASNQSLAVDDVDETPPGQCVVESDGNVDIHIMSLWFFHKLKDAVLQIDGLDGNDTAVDTSNISLIDTLQGIQDGPSVHNDRGKFTLTFLNEPSTTLYKIRLYVTGSADMNISCDGRAYAYSSSTQIREKIRRVQKPLRKSQGGTGFDSFHVLIIGGVMIVVGLVLVIMGIVKWRRAEHLKKELTPESFEMKELKLGAYEEISETEGGFSVSSCDGIDPKERYSRSPSNPRNKQLVHESNKHFNQTEVNDLNCPNALDESEIYSTVEDETNGPRQERRASRISDGTKTPTPLLLLMDSAVPRFPLRHVEGTNIFKHRDGLEESKGEDTEQDKNTYSQLNRAGRTLSFDSSNQKTYDHLRKEDDNDRSKSADVVLSGNVFNFKPKHTDSKGLGVHSGPSTETGMDENAMSVYEGTENDDHIYEDYESKKDNKARPVIIECRAPGNANLDKMDHVHDPSAYKNNPEKSSMESDETSDRRTTCVNRAFITDSPPPIPPAQGVRRPVSEHIYSEADWAPPQQRGTSNHDHLDGHRSPDNQPQALEEPELQHITSSWKPERAIACHEQTCIPKTEHTQDETEGHPYELVSDQVNTTPLIKNTVKYPAHNIVHDNNRVDEKTQLRSVEEDLDDPMSDRATKVMDPAVAMNSTCGGEADGHGPPETNKLHGKQSDHTANMKNNLPPSKETDGNAWYSNSIDYQRECGTYSAMDAENELEHNGRMCGPVVGSNYDKGNVSSELSERDASEQAVPEGCVTIEVHDGEEFLVSDNELYWSAK